MMPRSNSVIATFVIVVLLSSLVFSHSYAEEKAGGIGLMVTQTYDSQSDNKIGPLVVLYVIEGTPALQQGVEKGDIITHINGNPTAGKNFQDLVVNELRGPIGTTITLTIKRANQKEAIHARLTRVAFPDAYGRKE